MSIKPYHVVFNMSLVVAANSLEELTPEKLSELMLRELTGDGWDPRVGSNKVEVNLISTAEEIPEAWRGVLPWHADNSYNPEDKYITSFLPSPLEVLAEEA